MENIIGLRHDVDYSYQVERSIAKIVEIEDRHDARSTFFIRVRILERKPGLTRTLKKIEKDGWEAGLHLDNTTSFEKAREELEKLRSYGFAIRGATPHGGLYGFSGERTWRVLDSLGLEYIQGYGKPPFNIRTKVLPSHITLDWYIRRHGETRGYEIFKKQVEEKLSIDKLVIVMTHAEYFTFSVGLFGTMKPRSSGLHVRFLKTLSRATMIAGTILRTRMLNNPYKKFLEEMKDQVSFRTLYGVSKMICQK